jgi:hypothetical protein
MAEIAGVSRYPPTATLGHETRRADLRKLRLQLISSHCSNVDAVVNCAGTSLDAPGESTEGASSRVAALLAACLNQGGRVDPIFPQLASEREVTSFSATKYPEMPS